MLLPFTSPRPEERRTTCRDLSLRWKTHKDNQRYLNPETGICTRLRVQAMRPVPNTNQVKISDSVRWAPKLAVLLFCAPPATISQILLWPLRFILCSLFLLFWPLDGLPGGGSYTDVYPEYLMSYWGQMWAARSRREYSIFDKMVEKSPMPTPADFSATVKSITHALRPRRLAIYDESGWYLCDNPDIIINYRYVAVSYRQSDVFQRGFDDEGKKREEEQKKQFIESIRSTTLQCRLQAYWLDLECLGETTEDKNIDLYRISDIYRGAVFTLITLRKSDDQHSIESWRSWGSRVWTFPEALLSGELRYRIGLDGPVTPITLHELANKAYEYYSEETAIVNAYGGKDRLDRLEHLTRLKAAIWRRGSAALPKARDREKRRPQTAQQPQLQQTGSPNLSYPAERVYALMGFFEHRIMPSILETELQALARLSMANDSDRMAERMVSMLPQDIQPQACWYADDDQYGSELWDIEPEVNVAGVTERGALVLDGCRATCIRWQNFPEISFQRTESIRRTIAGRTPVTLPGWYFMQQLGTVFFACAAFMLVSGPFLTAYSISGRILATQPWLIGIKGVMSPEEAADHVYGATLSKRQRLFFTPSGSLLAKPVEDEIQQGLGSQYDEALAQTGDDIYTLIDTFSGTIYYFTAKCPPTVCLFTGREGGLGRFVLCSENCVANELHKEVVLRMPSYTHRAMIPCDWVAVGGARE
ncbi:hypothetical protein M404DRAFT_1009027 [Pisolithus tinctorius Marx 270]|uniref:Heterokaryon incompatibility domain-containing protein n=1 Tax=Pisolithus tinctorius Marx 270 TaxID=870435 RepID=A0A0C3NBZ3_PISTI|nr:hypothetical protein M404DRAFT_1009027 [Pisolithus tinctorius Marx 270]